MLFKSDYWLHENETYSLNFTLQRTKSVISSTNERYYRYYNEYPYNYVYAENCKIGIKRISQCTDENSIY